MHSTNGKKSVLFTYLKSEKFRAEDCFKNYIKLDAVSHVAFQLEICAHSALKGHAHSAYLPFPSAEDEEECIKRRRRRRHS